MSDPRFDAKRDGMGIVLFIVGVFFSVLIVVALRSSVPLRQVVGAPGALARMWILSLGPLPSLVFTAGIAVLGALLFVQGGGSRLRRNAGGLALVSLGLAVFFGSFSATAGGALGDLTAGTLARWTHVALALPVGLAAFLASVWFVWLRNGSLAAALAARVAPVAEGRKAEDVDEGVSADEAAALIPEPMPRMDAELRKQGTSVAPSAVLARATHTDDVRRRGEVPAGARPLEPKHVPQQPEVPSADLPVYHWIAPGAGDSDHAPGADLVVDPGIDPRREPEPVVEHVEEIFAAAQVAEEELELKPVRVYELELEEDELGSETVEPEPVAPEPVALEPAAKAEDEFEVEAEDFATAESELEPQALEEPETPVEPEAVRAPSAVPLPSWEQPSLFETEDEPVDSYGTPLSLVEAIEHDSKPDEAGREEPASEVAEAEASAEREVVLKPKAAAARAARKTRASTSAADAADDRAKLLVEAGCLFLDRGRVAVSMLQKHYDMDFDDACKVLDELQAMGLIGPYLGGQRRDILLTREQWLEKVSSS